MKHKSEAEFLQELERKSREERKLVGTEVLPVWAKSLGEWLVVNPWRVIVPIACIGYGVCRMGYGMQFRDFILGLFGGFK
jgi:hypothetical protein